MRGIVLCGGMGTRLLPLTLVTNKHLLPVYSKPMIYYPITTLVESGIRDIMLVCGGNAAGEFLRIIGNGEQFGLKHIAYTYQKEPAGIAHALGLAEYWACGEPICVILGDNIVETPVPEVVERFKANPHGAYIFITESENPERYGVVTLDDRGCVTKIVEKPKHPESSCVAIGMYLYDSSVWQYIRSLRLSERNELEVTDLNNQYLMRGKLRAHRLDGWWADCGESIDGYLDACVKVRSLRGGGHTKRFPPGFSWYSEV